MPSYWNTDLVCVIKKGRDYPLQANGWSRTCSGEKFSEKLLINGTRTDQSIAGCFTSTDLK